MATYPIRVPRENYKGSKESLKRKNAEYNRLAAELERYLNQKIEESKEEIQLFLYGFIAIDMGIPEETVRKILYPVDCGSNGLTVRKPITNQEPF